MIAIDVRERQRVGDCIFKAWPQVESALQRRVLRYFRRHGLLDEVDTGRTMAASAGDPKGGPEGKMFAD